MCSKENINSAISFDHFLMFDDSKILTFMNSLTLVRIRRAQNDMQNSIKNF